MKKKECKKCSSFELDRQMKVWRCQRCGKTRTVDEVERLLLAVK